MKPVLPVRITFILNCQLMMFVNEESEKALY